MANPSRKTIAVLPGDGVGPEVVPQAVKVLKSLNLSQLSFEEAPVGMAGFIAADDPLPPQTLELARRADAILLGCVGGPDYERELRSRKVRSGLLRLRQELDLFANLRPVRTIAQLAGASTLKPEIIDGLDLMIVRELSQDIYFGDPRGPVDRKDGRRESINTMRYDEDGIARVARFAFDLARGRKGRLLSVDKANVLETMQLWRDVVIEVFGDYKDVELTHLYIDAAAMRLLRKPTEFDVIVTGNMFGDILSDEAAMLVGSLGMLPSASLGPDGKGLYEPIHGAAPDIAGRDIANPLATILSAAMMLRISLGMPQEADRIEAAVETILADGLRTADIAEPGTRQVGTSEMGDAVAAALHR